MVLNKTAIGSVLGPEAGANIGARIDDVDKERVVLDNPVLDVLGNGVRRVVGFDLCAVARGSITSVGNAGRDVAERKEKTTARERETTRPKKKTYHSRRGSEGNIDGVQDGFGHGLGVQQARQ